jgi:prepilin-type N-terminal cleavage/methylation domain-containing protein
MNKKFSISNLQKGFTILEIITAIFIFTVGMSGTFALMQQTLSFSSIIESRVIATYLAQEGIEIIRNIRDNNWLEQIGNPSSPPSWKQHIDPASDCSNCCEADYSTFDSLNSVNCGYDDLTNLNIDANGLYTYGVGTPTKFKRKISIQENASGILEVSVDVIWKERDRTHDVEIFEQMTDWAGQ